MCGIVGIINFNKLEVDKKNLIHMNNIQIHRGPDAGEIYIDNNIGLGHRRLSIIDLSIEANQPMNYHESDFWIVFNGEVYNYLELRKELELIGYVFKTNSDTEVILASYIEWGEGSFDKFNGMWALAIYNYHTKELLICRDRFGVKPLYYYQDCEVFLFSSEKKAIVLSGFIGLEFDEKGIRTAIQNPFILEAAGYTEFKNIKSLLPGHLIRVKNNKVEIKKWYSLLENIEKSVPATFEKRIERFRWLLEDACKLRLRSDVPIATSLSGGLDSSSVVCVLSQIDSIKHKAFSHSFEGTHLDETKYAEIIANTTNTPIRKIEVNKKTSSKNIDEIIYYFESIYGGMPDSAYRIYKEQKESGYKISIDGHGADEMLGGYGWYLDEMRKDVSLFNVFKQIEVSQHKNEIISNKKEKNKSQFIIFIFNMLPDVLKSRIRIFLKKDSHNINDIYTFEKESLPKNFSHLKKRLYEDFSYTVLPRILKNFDAMSMANSIEVRMPFLDFRLVEYVFALPDSDLIDKKWTKYILRKSMDGIMDDRVNWRKDKIGLNSPVAEMLSSELSAWTLECINNIKENDFFDKSKLKEEFENKILQNENWGDSLEFWKKINTLKLIEIYKKRKENA